MLVFWWSGHINEIASHRYIPTKFFSAVGAVRERVSIILWLILKFITVFQVTEGCASLRCIDILYVMHLLYFDACYISSYSYPLMVEHGLQP